MRRNQLTITYPEGDAQRLHQALLLLKRSQHLNVSAFCQQRLRVGATGEKQMKTYIRLPDVEAAMLVEAEGQSGI